MLDWILNTPLLHVVQTLNFGPFIIKLTAQKMKFSLKVH